MIQRRKQFDELMYRAICTTVRDALGDILKTEYKSPTADGKEAIDYELTVRMIRSKARIALNIIENLETKKQ